jgi:hypothetical protein
MRIEVVVVPGCPHRTTAVAHVREALRALGRSDVVVSERVVEDAAAACAAGMRGSPTILVDGRDPFANEAGEPSLSCRLYRSADGVAGAPSVAELVSVLAS